MKQLYKNRYSLLIYIVSWAAVATAHFLILIFLKSDWQNALIEAIIYNGSFAFMGLYLVDFFKFTIQIKNYLIFFFNHLIYASTFISVWLISAYVLTQLLFATTNIIPETHDFIWYFNRVIIGLFFYIILSFIQYTSLYIQKIKEQSIYEERIKRDLKETQLKALKSQINPHFLFNSLNSISYLIRVEPDKAIEMLSTLSDYFRYSIKSKENTTSIENELKNCMKYLEIERIRFSDRLNNKEEIDESALSYEIPSMILQPLYENAVKHGVFESEDEVVIHTKIKEYDEYINIKIINNFNPDAITRKGEGLGLKNAAERLKIMFNTSDLLYYHKTEQNTFEVSINIPKPN